MVGQEYGTVTGVDIPGGHVVTMPDVISIIHQHQDTIPATVDTIPATVDTIPAMVVVTALTALTADMAVVTVDTVDTALLEDKPYNTYFIDNPLIIGG